MSRGSEGSDLGMIAVGGGCVIPIYAGGRVKRSIPAFCIAIMVSSALLPWSSPARATTCTSLPTFVQEVQLQPTNWNYPLLTIPKFDPVNGTLSLVVVRMSASLEAQLMATNTAGVPASLTATMNVNANITAPSPIANFTANPISSMQTIPVPAMGSTNFVAGPVPSSFQQTFTLPSDVSQFVGPGSLVFGASANGNFTFTTNTGNADVTGSTRASAKIEVTYCFVPEPGTLILLGCGMIGISRRRAIRSA